MAENLKIVFTDLDGTLLRADKSASVEDIETLRMLGERGVIRVAATGRSVYAARAALKNDFPLII